MSSLWLMTSSKNVPHFGRRPVDWLTWLNKYTNTITATNKDLYFLKMVNLRISILILSWVSRRTGIRVKWRQIRIMTLKTLGRCRTVMHWCRNLGPNKRYLGCNAFDAHEVVEVSRGQRSCCDVSGSEAAFEANVKLFALLGVARVQGSDILFQGTLQMR